MANVKNVWLIAGTSSGDQDGSADSLELEITLTSGEIELETSSGNRTGKWGSKDEPGDAVIWQWASSQWSNDFTVDEVTTIDVESEGSDAWLPSNLFVVFQDDENTYTLKGANGAWPSDQCFSTDSSDCGGDAEKSWQLYP